MDANVAYAKACMLDSLHRGEAPYASHLLLAQPGILNDTVPAERALGIAAGLAWGAKADLTAVYTDRGISGGMKLGIERAIAEGRPVVCRSLHTLDQVKIERCPDRESGGVQCILPEKHEEKHRCW